MATRAYGLTPWGAWFAQALADFDENGRLSRGKSYANTGKVVSIDFNGRSALARVRGRSRPWYTVRIDFPPLEDAAKEKLFALIEREPFLLSRIEAGELPAELIDRLKKAKIELICSSWDGMKRRCDCPDWGDPCKHMAAVYYLIAQEVDRDPGLLFRLRGVDLAGRFGRPEHGEKAAGLSAPLTLRPRGPGQESQVDPSASTYEPPSIDSYLGLVRSLIPPTTPFSQSAFAACLVEFYHRAAVEDPADYEPDSGLERGFSGASFALEIPADGAMKTPSLEAVERSIGLPVVVAVTEQGGRQRRFKAADLASLFLGFEDERGTPGYRYFFHLSRLAYAAWRGSAFVPSPMRDEAELRVAWIALPAARELSRALDALGALDPGFVSARLPGERRARPLEGGGVARLLLSSVLSDWARRLGFRPSSEKASQRELVDLFFAGGTVDVSAPGARLLPQAIASWLSILGLDFSSSEYRYRIEIDEAPGEGAEEAERFTIAMSVSRSTDSEGVRGKSVALKDAARSYGGLDALRVPTALSAYVPEIRRLASERRIVIERPRLASFLGDGASILRRLGVELVLPKALKKALSPRLVLEVKAKAKAVAGRSLRTYLDLVDVVQYDWKIAVGDSLLSPAEFQRLVRDKKDVVFFRDGFMRVDPAEAAAMLERASAGKGPHAREASALDLIAARLAGDAAFSADAEELAASLFAERDEAYPAGLRADLRPYQERGYRWIMSNLRSGFGCILADDMGLGKTVQAIAAMLRLADDGLADDGVLVVAPAALLTNWERELARFAPGLRASRYHGPGRRLRSGPVVQLTTYDTLARDAGKLSERGFSLLVCDEAQLMKNAEARRSRGVKSIKAAYRLALSGTPVENRLEDLRSIFDAVLPGYLGSPAEFKKRWRERIEIGRDREAAEKLKRVTAPFLLRRLKTDRDIAPDLPDKVVSDEYARLVPGQAALYENVVRSGLKRAERMEPGLGRAALVLELITSLKQICDHPRVYDKESPPKASLSGKCVLLLELVGAMLANREKVLVFSQYVETLELLRTVIRDELSEEPLIYHGGMGKKARDSAVDRFQREASARVMLVSLRAGGLGLNLTAASRVIHYDLWFNPAVESQATDRAFRIGQPRDVFVHRLIAAGTFEERIDEMLKDKAGLADMTVASGESWIAKLGVGELRELFDR